ncbi:uncharacterized protein LOC123721114 isoform X2 [Papilio machaon]|uniref:uncharacterized protein LOC123721114 isoform X2 n=1 Tax=Papilio machaon TaxID=76193 RepID=UPI001E66300E|nr:uncharacterized protein LOC123721114 isoform X2 [Papilio machaon]
MRGPYSVTRILPNDRYEMKLLSGSRGKTTQAAAQYMVLWNGEWCPESCSAFFDDNPDDDDVGETSDRPADPASADTSPQTGNEQELAAVTNTT